MPIVQQEENFKEAPPQLFGSDFAKKAKEHVDQMKAMRASLPKKGQKDNFFRSAPHPKYGGGGGGGGATATEATSTLGEEAGAASTTSTGTTKKERATSQASKVGTIRTRTSKQCCKHKIAKRCFTPYTEKTNSGHGRGPNYGPTQISWKASLPPEQLAGANKRSVGAKHCSGIQTGLHFRATPSLRGTTTHTPVLLRTAPADRGRGQSISPKRGCIGDTAWQPGRVLLKPISATQIKIKKDGGQRPVINLKPLNQFLQAEHFKMEGIHTLRDIVKPGDWPGKVT